MDNQSSLFLVWITRHPCGLKAQKLLAQGNTLRLGCVEVTAPCKGKSIWLSLHYACFCTCRAYTLSHTYPERCSGLYAFGLSARSLTSLQSESVCLRIEPGDATTKIGIGSRPVLKKKAQEQVCRTWVLLVFTFSVKPYLHSQNSQTRGFSIRLR